MSRIPFEKWLEEADIPEKVNGVWVDLETGIPFDEWNKPAPSEKKEPLEKISPEAAAARKKSKEWGASPLRGTKRQQQWAEVIRTDKLEYLSSALRKTVCEQKGLFGHSKFWIENRFKDATRIADFAVQVQTLVQSLHSQGNEGYARSSRFRTDISVLGIQCGLVT